MASSWKKSAFRPQYNQCARPGVATGWREIATHPHRRRSARGRRLGIHVAAIDRDGLPGDEIAVGAGQENQGTEEILRKLVALYGARRDGTCTGGLHVAWVFG